VEKQTQDLTKFINAGIKNFKRLMRRRGQRLLHARN